jgi:hypothetical protein
MSDRAMATLRRSLNNSMVDTAEVWSSPTSAHDDSTLIESPVPGTLLWTSPVRVTPTRGPREQPVGEGVMAMRDADLLFPWDSPEPIRDQEVKIVTSEDPNLAGRWFRITDVRAHSQQASRRVSAVQFQRSEQWNP